MFDQTSGFTDGTALTVGAQDFISGVATNYDVIHYYAVDVTITQMIDTFSGSVVVQFDHNTIAPGSSRNSLRVRRNSAAAAPSTAR